VHILEIGRPAISAERVTISVAERIQKNIQAPFYIDGHGVFTTASIGIAFSGSGYSAAEDMLGDANTAVSQGEDPRQGTVGNVRPLESTSRLRVRSPPLPTRRPS
jgi:GGDEF domain-containing protein